MVASPFDKNITVDQERIQVKPDIDKPQLVNVKLTNASEKVCLFKVMATHPKLYKIKNHVGSLKQSESKVIVVRLNPSVPRVQLNDNIIIIQTALCDEEPQNRDAFWKSANEESNNRQFMRLKVTTEDKVETNDEADAKPDANETNTNDPSRIKLDPTSIAFQGPYNDIVLRSFKISNLTEKFLFFRFLTSNEDLFRIRPSYAFIDPLANKTFAIMVRPLTSGEEEKVFKKKYGIRIEYFEADQKVENIAEAFATYEKKPFSKAVNVSIGS